MRSFLALTSVLCCAALLVAGGDDVAKDKKLIAGKWKTLIREQDGKKLPDDQLAKRKTVIAEDGKVTVEQEGKPIIAGTMKIDPTKKPKQVDITFTEGEFKGKTAPGIYEVDADNMKICYSLGKDLAKDRPTDFSTKPGSNRILAVLKREPPPKEFASSSGIKFIYVYPGNFTMGSGEKEEGRAADELPHKVTLTKGYFLAIQTVTQEQYQAVMGNNPSHFKGEKNLPVENVSWNDCIAFCKKLFDKDKKPYRLPTEAEWEFACRAGTTTPFCYGDTISTDQANYNGDEVYGKGKKGVARNQTTPVGTFPPNAWGLYDMHGNVWQWCNDNYAEFPKDLKEATDPQGPPAGAAKVVRGGARYNSPAMCRCASRQAYLPTYRGSYIGFRICFTE